MKLSYVVPHWSRVKHFPKSLYIKIHMVLQPHREAFLKLPNIVIGGNLPYLLSLGLQRLQVVGDVLQLLLQLSTFTLV